MSIRWTWAFIDRPTARLDAARTFWTAVTDTRLSELRGDNEEFVTLLPSEGDACVKLQGIDSGAGGAHLDFDVDDVDAFVAAAVGLGADVVAPHGDWAVLRSPGGQLFCAVPWQGSSVRPPVVADSRLDQVCLDIPPSVYEAEVDFWVALTGWELSAGSLPEFRTLQPPPGFGVRILLQRLAAEQPASAHLDLACADVEATRVRHEALGATAVTRGRHWTVMRDPAGGTYCLTGRDPRTGTLPRPGTV